VPANFQPYERRVENVYRRFPGEAKQQVLLSRLFVHAFKGMEQDFNDALAQFGLNVTTWTALICLYSDPENSVNPSVISEAIVLSRTNITRVADELAEKGLVERCACPDDRRKVNLSLTPAGVTFIERVIPAMRAHSLRIWSVLDESEQVLLEQLLRKLLSGA
jgi:MarR family transcriptional repressor of emrRAB